ncbi:MAG TPA: tetratricopeptide repeat protein [Actinocrinis sp.]|nr:tetratricopeptide repeat protein [Actinocrinis sp.]
MSENALVRSAEEWTRHPSDPASALASAMSAVPALCFTPHLAAVAAAICPGEACRHLAVLAAMDLVQRDGDRYHMAAEQPGAGAGDPDAARRIVAWHLHAADAALSAMGMNIRYQPLSGPAAQELPEAPGGFHDGYGWLWAHRENLLVVLRVAVDRGWCEQGWQLAVILAEVCALTNDTVRWSQVIELGSQAAVKAGSAAGEAMMLATHGKLFAQQGFTILAESLQRQALSLREHLDDRPGLVRSYIALGLVRRRQGEISQAQDMFEAAEDLARQIDDPAMVAVTALHQAGVFIELGSFTEAEELICQSRAFLHGRAPLYAASAASTLSWALRGQGRLVEALEVCTVAVAESASLPAPVFLAGALTEHARVLFAAGRTGQALTVAREAAALYRGLGDRQRYAILLDLGARLHEDLGQDEQARVLTVHAATLRVQLHAEDRTPALTPTTDPRH